MVQNPIDPPRISASSLSFSVTRKRVRSNSQPIQPLRLPNVQRMSPSHRQPRSDQSLTKNPPKITSIPVDGFVPTSRVVSTDRAVPIEDKRLDDQVNNCSEDVFTDFHATASVPGNERFSNPSSMQSQGQLDPLQSVQLPKEKQPFAPLAPIGGWLQSTCSQGRKLAANISIASANVYQAVAPKVIQSSQRFKPDQQTQQWLAVWFSVLGTFSGITALAFVWLASPPPSANCRKVSLDSPGVQRLYCAQSLVRSGELPDLVAGIKLVENWSPEQPFYRDAQQAVADWSALILVVARGRMAQSDLAGAIEAASQIPESSPVYPQAQEVMAAWQQEWQAGEAILSKAQEAIQAQNWRQASQQVVELGYLNHEYWRLQQADILFKQVVREKTARESLTHAQKLAKENHPEKLAEAITLLGKVAPDTYATAEAEAALKQWSQTLIAVGLEQWQQGDRVGALATAQAIPLNPDLPSDGKDLIQMSRAMQLAEISLSRTELVPSIKQSWQLMEAVAATQSIAPSSPFYNDAQAMMSSWQSHLQDLNRLLLANTIANSGDRGALESAIAQAEQVTGERPRRLQAQTLIANWQLTIQSLEDQPFLARAEQWARSGEIPDLKAAIAQVKVIPSDRPIWTKAQRLIAEWTAQIQTIEDQPLWNKAQQLAKQGKLQEAIAAAEKIQPNRALYEQAQMGIATWKSEIQAAEIAEDQPILDRAYGLASQQRLSLAIDAASQIAPGRALYSEAQAAISAWSKERDYLWKVWADEPLPASSTDAISEPEYDDRTDEESN